MLQQTKPSFATFLMMITAGMTTGLMLYWLQGRDKNSQEILVESMPSTVNSISRRRPE